MSRTSSNSLDVCDALSFQGSSTPIGFVGRSNIWIDNVDEAQSVYAARCLIYEALANTSPGQLTIVGYDSELSGVFAPFASLSAGDVRELQLLSSEEELVRKLSDLRRQVLAVQNVIQGREKSLVDFRRMVGRPVEGYLLVVLFMDMGMVANDLRADVALLMKSGPAAGISFLIVSTTMISFSTPSGEQVDLQVGDLVTNVTILDIEGKQATIIGSGKKVMLPHHSALDFVRLTQTSIERLRSSILPTVAYNEIHDTARMWDLSTVDGVRFRIGKYGLEDVEVTMGDEASQRHNALITGAVGQGKSNLISLIVHSMCQRYSPHELRLYLLDFKEGVTFKAYSNIGKDDYLPHAATLGLESDVSFGIAVLESLQAEYRRRMAVMKEANVKSLKELRERDSTTVMPRIVVIIDEFQMMFGDDMQTGSKVADLLEKSVRLYRAAGIHFILSSQTLSGNLVLAQKADAIFSQVPIRIALKNSESESMRTLSMGNRAAADLRPREAIVNLDYGEVSQNHKTIVAFADEKLLGPMRINWWTRARKNMLAPYVFESERICSIRHAVDAVVSLRNSADAPSAVIGDRISIDGAKLVLPMPAEPGRNIAIIGTPDAAVNHAVGMIQSAFVSLAYQHPKGDASFLLCDFTCEGSHLDRFPHFAAEMESAGFYVEELRSIEFEDKVRELANGESGDEVVYVAGIAMDRWMFERDPYGQGSALKSLVEVGPAKGVHFLGWWTKSSSYTEQVAGYGNSDAFNTKVFLRVDERTVQSLTSPFVKWSSRTNRALASDPIEFAEEIPFVPYAPLGPSDVGAFRSSIW